MAKRINQMKRRYLISVVEPLVQAALEPNILKALEEQKRLERQKSQRKASRERVLAKWLAESIRNPILAPKKKPVEPKRAPHVISLKKVVENTDA